VMFRRTLMECLSRGVADDRSPGGNASCEVKASSSPRRSADPSWQRDGLHPKAHV